MTEATLETERPLVTFALFAYNQERYIREAVEGAFSQTYEPLEIILSDDCSSDRTFEIMQEMAAEYKGPHRLMVRQSEQNMGIGLHIGSVGAQSNGELIIVAAGDDISYENRVMALTQRWLNNDKKVMAIESNFDRITPGGEKIPGRGGFVSGNFTMERAVAKNIFILGATAAYDKRIFSDFPPLLKTVVYEDCVLPFRALLLNGNVGFVDDALVAYRQDVGVTATYRSMEALVFSGRILSIWTQKLSDSRHVSRFDICLAISDGISRYSSEAYALSCNSAFSSLPKLLRYGGVKWGLRAYLKAIYRRAKEAVDGQR